MIAAQPLRTIRLGGRLGDLYGREHRVAVDSPGEALQWCCYMLKGDARRGVPSFADVFCDGSRYALVRKGASVDGDAMRLKLGKTEVLSIVPEASGGKSGGGAVKFLLGAVLIAAAFVFMPGTAFVAAEGIAGGLGGVTATAAGLSAAGTQVAFLGAGLALSGIQRLLTQTPHVGSNQQRERADQRNNFMLNSVTNQSETGACLPYVAGLNVRVGTILGSAGVRIRYTPLDELIDEQTDFDAYYNLTPLPLVSLSSDDVDFVGYSRIAIRDEDASYPDGERGPYGALDPISFRNTQIYMIGETRDRSSGERHLHVVMDRMKGNLPRDHFQLIRITSVDESTEYVVEATSNVDEFEDSEQRQSFMREQNRFGGWSDVVKRMTRWTWSLGTGGATVLPNAGDPLRVKMSY